MGTGHSLLYPNIPTLFKTLHGVIVQYPCTGAIANPIVLLALALQSATTLVASWSAAGQLLGPADETSPSVYKRERHPGKEQHINLQATE